MGTAEYELDEMRAIIDEFMVETNEIVNALDSNLVKLEKEPANLDLLNEIFRGAHTMKGASGFLGFNELMRLTHRMEDVLNRLRKGELKVTAEVMDVLLEAVDFVKLVLQDILENKQGSTELTEIIGKLVKINEGGSPTANSATAQPTEQPLQASPETEKTREPMKAMADQPALVQGDRKSVV